MSYKINGDVYTHNYDIKLNDKLKEYYMVLKHGIRRMGKDLVANKNLFFDKTYSKVILKVDKLLPLYGGLMKVASCHPSNSDEKDIVRNLTKMQSIYHRDAKLHKRVAFIATLINRNHLLCLGEKFPKSEQDLIGCDFVELLEEKMYT